MEDADACGMCKTAAVALPALRRASKAGIWLSLLAEVILGNWSDFHSAFLLSPPSLEELQMRMKSAWRARCTHTPPC